MCYPPDESNNILPMKITFKRAKPRNKLGISTHSYYDCKSTNYNYNNYQKPHHSSKDYNISPSRKTNIICYICYKKRPQGFPMSI